MSHPDPVSAELAHLLEHSALSRGWAKQDQGPYHRDVEPVRHDIAEDRPGETLLRGCQITNAAGAAEFRTIYPGWYPGPAVHIHTIVHSTSATFTSQPCFPDPTSDEVLLTDPYSERPGRDTTNSTDTIFDTGGTPPCSTSPVPPTATGPLSAWSFPRQPSCDERPGDQR